MRWYQLTPAAALACPHCDGRVASTAANSRWLLLPFATLGLIMPALFGLYRLPLPAQALLFAVAVLGVWRAQATARLVRYARKD